MVIPLLLPSALVTWNHAIIVPATLWVLLVPVSPSFCSHLPTKPFIFSSHQNTFLLSSLFIVLPFKVSYSEEGVEWQAESLLTLKMPQSWQN